MTKQLTKPQVLKAIKHHFDERPAMLKDYERRRIFMGDIATDVHNRLLNQHSALMHLDSYGVFAFTAIVKNYYHGCWYGNTYQDTSKNGSNRSRVRPTV